jgi:hypothetical protein
MRKVVILLAVLMLTAVTAYAVPFEPPVVTISTQSIGEWAGGNVEIDFDLSGRDCTVYLVIYTNDQGGEIEYAKSTALASGLEYHEVFGIDTCVYVSGGETFSEGNGRQIVWDGTDKIGQTVPVMDYTFYLLAIDEGASGDPIEVGATLSSGASGNQIVQYVLDDGTVLDKPRAWKRFSYYELGQDTETGEFVTFQDPVPPTGGNIAYTTFPDPNNNQILYWQTGSTELEMCALSKALLSSVEGTPSEAMTDFGDEGFAWYTQMLGQVASAGQGSQGAQYYDGILATISMDYMDTYCDVYTFDAETGEELNVFDISPWYTAPEQEAQKTGGPNNVNLSQTMPYRLTTAAYSGCMRIAMDITADPDGQFMTWTNGNGDYYCDKNFPGCQGYTEDAEWVCQDYNPGVYNYSSDPDDFDFVQYPNNWAGTGKSQILGPDGYGICTTVTIGQVEGNNRHWEIVVFGGTAYDGLYAMWTRDSGEVDGDGNPIIAKSDAWQGYDITTGIISTGVGVEDETPVAYSLSNAPDPFNPATTISYSMGKAGNVNLEVFNVLGQKVASLFDGHREAGSYSVRWDASDFANGVYFAVMKTEGFTKTEKMMLVK